MDCLITPGHKIVTERGLVPIEFLKQSDIVVMMGVSTDATPNLNYIPRTIPADLLDFHGGVGTDENVPTTRYTGRVWCPETEFGCFVARRNGKIYLTGNTYNDEMRSQALLQLSQIGLKFDESKSENPFAYYTAAVKNSFTRVLNIEKRNQNIRDDLLEMNNLEASYTRQLDTSLGYRED